MKVAVYPGSFDPITNGHMEVLKRSLQVFDEVILLLAVNSNKKSRFDVEERVVMMKEAVADMPNVKVDYTDGLTVDYCKASGARHIIRGLRFVSDFEYEFQLAAANKFISEEIDMVFFMADKSTSFLSSSLVDELYQNGTDISSLVPPSVVKAYKKK